MESQERNLSHPRFLHHLSKNNYYNGYNSQVLSLLPLIPSYQGSVEDTGTLKEKFRGLSPNLIINLACISEKIWENVDFLEINSVKQLYTSHLVQCIIILVCVMLRVK